MLIKLFLLYNKYVHYNSLEGCQIFLLFPYLFNVCHRKKKTMAEGMQECPSMLHSQNLPEVFEMFQKFPHQTWLEKAG